MFEIDPVVANENRSVVSPVDVSEARCCWPLPRIAGVVPVASHVAGEWRGGVDVGYGDHPFAGDIFVPVYAVCGGLVSLACGLREGYAVTLDHGAWCTRYAHMSRMFVGPKLWGTHKLERVREGDVIGYAAAAPIHVRFELWLRDGRHSFVPADPTDYLKAWRVESPVEHLRPLAIGAREAA